MNKEVLKQAINTYGTQSQMDMCIEECSELIKAILKYRRNIHTIELFKSKYISDIVEELADCKIMIEQMEIMLKCEKEVEEQVEFKINRLNKRLNK